MTRELDRRTFKKSPASGELATLRSAAETVSAGLPGAHRVQVEAFDETRGGTRTIRSLSAPARRGDWVRRAQAHLGRIGRVMGFRADDEAEYKVDDKFQEASDGSVTVHVQQCHAGIEIFQAAQAVRFAPDGRLKETVGQAVGVAGAPSPTPRLSVEEAAKKAAAHVAEPDDDEKGVVDAFGEPLAWKSVDLSGFDPRVVQREADSPEQVAYLEAPPFEDRIRAQLIWFPVDDRMRLAWEYVVTMPERTGQYRVLVGADDGTILYCRQLMLHVASRGNVYHTDGASARQHTPFPRPLTDYGLPIPPDLPAGMPEDWVATDQAVGNSVLARLGTSSQTAKGTAQNGVVVFDPADTTGDMQKVLNIFYFNCVMHDFFYLLGFRERDGNFQRLNFGRGGVESDRVDARAHSGPVQGTANMLTPSDGSAPEMNMGLVSSTNRHTAFDASVVYHEFTHGVSNRLVGGPQNSRALDEPQSGGMGEGWGDYIACSILGTTTVGHWVVNNPSGIRGFRYDASFPDNFGDVGNGRYREVHNIGEIWCATMMDLNRRIGRNLTLQLVVDSFKAAPANPSLLDARDAILTVLDNRLDAGLMTLTEHALAKNGAWEVFAARGMGPDAQSLFASLEGIVADFNPPAALPVPGEDGPPPDPGPEPSVDHVQVEAAPNVPIPDAQPAGIASKITVGATSAIAALSVTVEIEHTFIGDLRVDLTSPAGTKVALHAGEGGSTDDLVRTYTVADLQALASFAGEPANGDWTLRVADVVGQDTGRLKRWGLDIGLEPAGDQPRFRSLDTPKAIPDASPEGIRSSIVVPNPLPIQRVTVAVEITHTFVGDLKVALFPPDRGELVLQQGADGSQDDLVRTYTAVDVPALGDLQGSDAKGEWTLAVTDLAGQDVGTLASWSLAFLVGAAPANAVGESAPALAIPDLDPTGVQDAIAIGAPGRIRSIRVNVDITHTFRADLRVSLFSPSGTRVELHQNTGGSADDLVATYTDADTPALRAVLGEEGQGNWLLRVGDLVGGDVGRLNRWGVALDYV